MCGTLAPVAVGDVQSHLTVLEVLTEQKIIMKSITTIILVLIVLGGAWVLLGGAKSVPLTVLTPLEKSALKASTVLAPEQPVAGETTKLTFTFTDESGNPAALVLHHARRVHVVIISKDLATLGHIHPQDFSSDMAPEVKSGVYSVEYAFPEAGKYIVAVDVMSDAETLAQQFLVNVTGSPSMGRVKDDMSLSKCFKGYTQEATDEYTKPFLVADMEVACSDGYKITLAPGSSKIIAGAETLLRLHVEKGGKPVTDLAPYLSAPIHFAIVPESLAFTLHRHGSVDETLASDDMAMGDQQAMAMKIDDHVSMEGMEGMHHDDDVPTAFGPDLISEPIAFPQPGKYRVFVQMKHGAEIITADFMVDVAQGIAGTGVTKTFDLTVTGKKIVSGSSTLTVNQGDTVSITVTDTDEGEELHVHGYDKSVEFEKGEKATITFVASASGRFPFELENSKTDIGALEVMPQ